MSGRVLALIVSLVSLAGCGGESPTAPTPPPPANLAGLWQGTLEATNFAPQVVRLDLAQTGANVSGTWGVQTASNWNGTISGTVGPSSFTGTATFSSPSTTGGRCTGTIAWSGSVTARQIEWTSPGVAGSDCYGLPANLRLSATRQ